MLLLQLLHLLVQQIQLALKPIQIVQLLDHLGQEPSDLWSQSFVNHLSDVSFDQLQLHLVVPLVAIVVSYHNHVVFEEGCFVNHLLYILPL